MQWVLENGADPALAKCTGEYDTIGCACRFATPEKLELLHKFGGMSYDYVDPHGDTLLHTAISYGNRRIAQWLINRGVIEEYAYDPPYPVQMPDWAEQMITNYKFYQRVCATVYYVARIRLGRDVAKCIVCEVWKTVTSEGFSWPLQ